MDSFLTSCHQGLTAFKQKYASGDASLLSQLTQQGQAPNMLVVSCVDSRVDPALLFGSKPGELLIVRNVANIVPPFENDEYHHGTSAALEFGICYLHIPQLLILGHSLCGGINAHLNKETLKQDDFISNWVSLSQLDTQTQADPDALTKQSLRNSYQNCLTFPWIKSRVDNNQLAIHTWFFDLKAESMLAYDEQHADFIPLSDHLADNK